MGKTNTLNIRIKDSELQICIELTGRLKVVQKRALFLLCETRFTRAFLKGDLKMLQGAEELVLLHLCVLEWCPMQFVMQGIIENSFGSCSEPHHIV